MDTPKRTWTALAAGLLLLGSALVGQEAGAKGARALRTRLSELVAIENDNRFLAAFAEWLGEYGVEPVLVKGETHALGAGFTLATQASSGPEWVLRTDGGGETRLPKGRFVKFLAAGEVLDAAPTAPEALAACVVFIGDGDTVSLFSLQRGRMRRLQL